MFFFSIIISVVLVKGQSRFVASYMTPDGQGAGSRPHNLVP